MAIPLVSVVIPTYCRPHLLPRAVASALQTGPQSETEVIVVPNGADDSWRISLTQWKHDSRVRVCPITEAQGNLARNHGLALATGKYVRFLDDDDYLLPASTEQMTALERTDADVSSGAVRAEEVSGRLVRRYSQPDTQDFVVAAVCPERRSHSFAHLYRRERLTGVHWRADVTVRQDVAWLMDVAASRELAWIRSQQEVGVWIQHRGPRVSRGHDSGAAALKAEADIVRMIHHRLVSEGRMTPAREVAFADALWSLLQKGLRYDPRYWYGIAREADGYSPRRRPPSRIHGIPMLRPIPPLAIETALIPVRWAYAPFRRVLDQFGINRA